MPCRSWELASALKYSRLIQEQAVSNQRRHVLHRRFAGLLLYRANDCVQPELPVSNPCQRPAAGSVVTNPPSPRAATDGGKKPGGQNGTVASNEKPGAAGSPASAETSPHAMEIADRW